MNALFVTYWLFAETETEEEACRAHYLVLYGEASWPSHSEWMVPCAHSSS